MSAGHAGSDLGRIHGGSSILWTATCCDCSWADRDPNGVASRELTKQAATRMARSHVRAFPLHRVILEARTWQLVYGSLRARDDYR